MAARKARNAGAPPAVEPELIANALAKAVYDGDIVNLKMLFLTPPQVRQILIHELCHTRHHNHSRAFWGLVSSLDSGDSAIRAEIRASWRTIPAWI